MEVLDTESSDNGDHFHAKQYVPDSCDSDDPQSGPEFSHLRMRQYNVPDKGKNIEIVSGPYKLHINRKDNARTFWIHDIEREEDLFAVLFPRAFNAQLAKAIRQLRLGSKAYASWPKNKLLSTLHQVFVDADPSVDLREKVLQALRPAKSTRTKEWYSSQLEHYGLSAPDDNTKLIVAGVRGVLESACIRGKTDIVPSSVFALQDMLVEEHHRKAKESQRRLDEHKDALWLSALASSSDAAAKLDPCRFLEHWDKTASRDATTTLVISTNPRGETADWLEKAAKKVGIPITIVRASYVRLRRRGLIRRRAACRTKVVIGRSESAIISVAEQAVGAEMRSALARVKAKLVELARKEQEREEAERTKKRQRLNQLSDVVSSRQPAWDVRGRWSMECKVAEEYKHGVVCTMEINGDGTSLLVGSFHLGFLEGHFKLNQACVTEQQCRVKVKFGSRETGEGMITDFADQEESYLAFSDDGRRFHGVLHSQNGTLPISGWHVTAAKEARLPSVELLHRQLKQYTSRRYEHERVSRWGRGRYFESSSDEGSELVAHCVF